MFVAMLVAWAVAASIPALDPLFRGSSEPLGLILGAAAIFVVGLIDDFRDMSAPAKVAGEVLAATILYFMGVTWFQFKIPLAGLVQLSPEWTPLLTALWVIAITNAVNLIDGLDGLAAGVVAIASGALAVYGLHLQHLGNLQTDNIGPLIAVITCGICLGFLPHNFHPAKIFMGDAGALAAGAVDGGLHHAHRGTGVRATSVGWPPTPGRPTSSSPPVHPVLHPRGAHGGHGLRLRAPHRQPHRVRHPGQEPPPPPAAPPGPRAPPERAHPVGLDALLSGFILFPLYISSVNAIIPFGALALGVILYTLFHPSLRREADPGPEAVDPDPPAEEPDPGEVTVPAGPGPLDAPAPTQHRRRCHRVCRPSRRRACRPSRRPACRLPSPGRCRDRPANGRARGDDPDRAGTPRTGAGQGNAGRHRDGGPRAETRSPVPGGPVLDRTVNGVFPTFCRHDLGGAMMLPVNCRPVATSVGIERAGHSTGYNSRTTA